jgi:hypothetical protein
MLDAPAPRLVEALALLPLLFLPVGATTVYAVGPLAEALARDALRWRDTQKVYLLEPPTSLRDKRVEVGRPAAGTCDAVLLSPDLDPLAHLFALAPHGVVNAAVSNPAKAPALFSALRQVFPRDGEQARTLPWREYLPAPLFGMLASPGGKPSRMRPPPKGTARLTPQYLPVLFTFGKDELPLVLGPTAG